MSSQALKELLQKLYGRHLSVRCGKSYHFKFDIGNTFDDIDYAVYLREDLKIAIIWDVRHRRESGSTSHNLSFEQASYNIDFEKTHQGYIFCVYKTFRCADKSFKYEKFIILDFDTLSKNINLIPYYLEFDSEDDSFPRELNISTSPRGRHMSSAWNRSVNFRSKVLAAYHTKCAVCRCREEKLLEAAHITPVASGGSDDVSNGICLCANHHLMLDNALITIDYQSLQLSVHSDFVKKMAWYKEFQEKYHGVILKRQAE